MASPGGRETDRVSVRVVPDTSRFAADLLRDLNRIESAMSVAVRVDADTDPLTDEVRTRLAALRDERVNIHVDADRDGLDGLRSALAGLGRESGGAGGPLSGIARTLGNVRIAAVTAVPNVAGLAAGLAQMAPAAGVAATGLVAAASAGAALKIGMSGVADAIGGDAEALAKLAPSARAFVGAVQDMRPAFDDLKTSVQQSLFAGLDTSVRQLGTSVLPVLRTQLTDTAGALNATGKGAATAAADLAESGTLGKAMSSANAGLRNLSGVPALVVRSLGQIAAAAGPSFASLTEAAAGAAQGVSDRLNNAFESGGMQRAIQGAVSLVGQLFDTLKNLGTAVGNIFGPAAAAGAGFLGVLNSVSQTLADVTGTAQAQQAFTGLFDTLAAAGRVISGVLGTALKAALPLLSSLVNALAGPLQDAFAVLSPALNTLVNALGGALRPVVSAVAGVLAQVVPIAAQLVAQFAGSGGLAPVLVQVGSVVGQLVNVLDTALQPILAKLPQIVAPFLALVQQMVPMLAQLASTLITAAGPALAQLGAALGQVLVAAAPLVLTIHRLATQVLAALMPILIPLIRLVGQLANVAAKILAAYLTNILVPALNIVTALLSGDFSGAWTQAKALVARVAGYFKTVFTNLGKWAAAGVGSVVTWLASLPRRAISAASTFGSSLRSLVAGGFNLAAGAARSGVSSVIAQVRGLPGKAKSALGNLGSVLVGAGKALIRGFISGITSMFNSVKSKLGQLTDMLPDLKGPPKRDARILRPAGRLAIAGFMDGITDAVPDLRAQLRSVTDEIAGHRPTVAPQLDMPALSTPADNRGRRDPVVSIGTFVAQERQSPAGIARELAWLAKGRG